MPNFKIRPCDNPECNKEYKQYNSMVKHCSGACKIAHKGKPKGIERSQKKINPASKKQTVRNLQYSADRKVFLEKPENEFCFIEGCGKHADTIEHTKGRKGYADEWARDNGIWLLNDIRFWKPCCLEHNLELENNPELSKEYQLSKLHKGEK